MLKRPKNAMFAVLLVVVLSVVTVSTLSYAPLAMAQSDVLIQSDTSFLNTFNFGGQNLGGLQIGTTLITSYSYTPTRISFSLGRYGGDPGGSLSVIIYEVSGSTIGSAVATSDSVSSLSLDNDMYAAFHPVTFTFSSAPLLSANTRYAYVVTVSGANVQTSTFFWIGQSDDGSFVQNYGGVWTVDLSGSQGEMFELYGLPAGYTTPTASSPAYTQTPQNTYPAQTTATQTPTQYPVVTPTPQTEPKNIFDFSQLSPTLVFIVIVAAAVIVLIAAIIAVALRPQKRKR